MTDGVLGTLGILTFVLLLGAVQGGVLSVLFWFRRVGDRSANRLLAALFVCMTAYLGETYLWAAGLLEHWPYLDSISIPAMFFVGPLYWLYARRLLEPNFRPRLRHAWHAVPGLVGLFARLPWMMLPVEARIPEYRMVSSGAPFEIGPVTTIGLGAQLALCAVYFALTVRVVRRQRALARDPRPLFRDPVASRRTSRSVSSSTTPSLGSGNISRTRPAILDTLRGEEISFSTSFSS